MLAKLLSLLIAGKGGTLAAATIVAGATTVSVMTTSPEVQDAVSALSHVTSPGMSQLARTNDDCRDGGQPIVVAQRNAAGKLLRSAHHDEHKRLVGLRGGKDVDHRAANELLRTADRELKAVLTQALNDVARETIGREGHLKLSEASPTPSSATESPSPVPTTSAEPTPSGSPTPKPSCTPKPSASPTPAASASPAPAESPSVEQRGRAAVAARVALDATIEAIVDAATTEMKGIVKDAEADLAALSRTERGRPTKDNSKSHAGERPEFRDSTKVSKHAGGKPAGAPRRP